MIDANYATLTKWVKLQHEKIKYTECRLWANIHEIYWDFRSARIFLYKKKNVVETNLVAITDSYDVQCLDLYLINIFKKSTKAERCTDITLKLTLYCLSVTVEDLNL